MRAATRTSTVLKRAKADIERGWCKGACLIIKGRKDRFCSVGALMDATGATWEPYTGRDAEYDGFGYDRKAYDKAEGYLESALEALSEKGTKRSHFVKAVTHNSHYSVIDFNDDHKTRKQHVLKMYDEAIRLAERDEWRARQRASRAARRAAVGA